MTLSECEEYISAIRARYKKATEGQKSAILCVLCEVCGYTAGHMQSGLWELRRHPGRVDRVERESKVRGLSRFSICFDLI